MVQPSPILVGLGRAVRDARADLRISQEELGLRTGIHRNYVGGIERGERNPSIVTVAKLADALDVSMSELFAEVEASV